jgi:N-acetylmuramoyl-L-alanine amidase
MERSIYLSPSSQERNIGAGNYGTEERRCNAVVDVVEPILKRYGFIVYRNKPTMSLTQIVNDSNSKKPDVHFAVHTNAFDKKTRGCEVYCHRYGGEGEKLARAVYKEISAITPTSDRGVKEGYKFYHGKPMYETCYTTAPAALIEIIFHDNPDDAKWFIANIEKIGIALVKGILNYFGLKFHEQTEKKPEYYRVVAGSYVNRENAENQVKRLKKDGFDSFIMKGCD